MGENQKKYDVFISFSSENEDKATVICQNLENHGISCFFAPSTIRGSQRFMEVIPPAIEASRAFLLLASDSVNKSVWVPREISWAVQHANIPMYEFVLEDCTLSPRMAFEMDNAQNYPTSLGYEEQMRRLLADLEDLLQREHKDPGTIVPLPKRGKKLLPWLIGGGVAVVAAAVIAAVLLLGGGLTDGEYVIWNPRYSVAMTDETAADHYRAGEQLQLKDGKLNHYSDKCVWELDFEDNKTVTISKNGQKLGCRSGYNGIGLGGNYTDTVWILEEAGDDLYYLRNQASGKYLEWYVQKNNWSTHDRSPEIQDMFELRLTKAD